METKGNNMASHPAPSPMERQERVKTRNPFRFTIRDLVARHAMSVGRGFAKATDPVETTIELHDGSKYKVTLVRVADAQRDVDPFAFPRQARKKRRAA